MSPRQFLKVFDFGKKQDGMDEKIVYNARGHPHLSDICNRKQSVIQKTKFVEVSKQHLKHICNNQKHEGVAGDVFLKKPFEAVERELHALMY